MRVERISDEFTKYHLNHEGLLPFYPVLHHFTAPDNSDWNDAHDHPWSFTSYVLKGGYVEDVYEVFPNGDWRMESFYRAPGTVHHVSARHIHRITHLPEGECWTLVVAGPQERETHFWKFDERGAHCRPWSSDEFTTIGA